VGTHKERQSARIRNFDQDNSFLELVDAPNKPKFYLRDISALGLGFLCPVENEDLRGILQTERPIICRLVINRKAFEVAIKIVRLDESSMVGCILVQGELKEYKQLYNELALACLQQNM